MVIFLPHIHKMCNLSFFPSDFFFYFILKKISINPFQITHLVLIFGAFKLKNSQKQRFCISKYRTNLFKPSSYPFKICFEFFFYGINKMVSKRFLFLNFSLDFFFSMGMFFCFCKFFCCPFCSVFCINHKLLKFSVMAQFIYN